MFDFAEENVSGAKLAVTMPVWLPGHCLCRCWGQKTLFFHLVYGPAGENGASDHLQLSSAAHHTNAALTHSTLLLSVSSLIR